MEQETIIRERIMQVIASKKLNFNSMANGDANLARKIHKQLAESKTLTYAVIGVIISQVSDLSTEWLFRGVGRPFLSDEDDKIINTSENTESTPQQYREEPYATANGDGAVAIAGDNNVTIPKQVLDMLAEKDRQLSAKDDIIKQYIMRK